MSSEYEILKSEFEKLKAELAEYKERFSDARKTALAHSEELTFRGQRISDLKAKLAEVEAEDGLLREYKVMHGMGYDLKSMDDLCKERNRELEAAKVMREALCSIEGGDARDEKEAGEIARTAIAKADEIRGGYETKMPCPDKDIDPFG